MYKKDSIDIEYAVCGEFQFRIYSHDHISKSVHIIACSKIKNILLCLSIRIETNIRCTINDLYTVPT